MGVYKTILIESNFVNKVACKLERYYCRQAIKNLEKVAELEKFIKNN